MAIFVLVSAASLVIALAATIGYFTASNCSKYVKTEFYCYNIVGLDSPLLDNDFQRQVSLPPPKKVCQEA